MINTFCSFKKISEGQSFCGQLKNNYCAHNLRGGNLLMKDSVYTVRYNTVQRNSFFLTYRIHHSLDSRSSLSWLVRFRFSWQIELKTIFPANWKSGVAARGGGGGRGHKKVMCQLYCTVVYVGYSTMLCVLR